MNDETIKTSPINTKIVSGSSMDVIDNVEYKNTGGNRELNYNEKKSIGNIRGLMLDQSAIAQNTFRTAWQNPDKRRHMQNEDSDNISNDLNFPIKESDSTDTKTAKYDYSIQVGDTRYPLMISLEDKLMEIRKSIGIPVHGNEDMARAMKYYMFNRFKTPDTNLAHNKSFTYVFFTRPDLNLLTMGGGANEQVKNHSETAILWRRNPNLFKLLTDYRRCNDNDNFNILLSNQVTSFDIQDEMLSTIEVGKTWSNYEMIYGDEYSGRGAGDFNCNFTETSDYSIINLLKLWITYIHNVRRGIWTPSYNLFGTGVNTMPNASHIYSKTLDYAASCYVFKCGPDGEDVLYWTKYFGIIPINTGVSALSWDLSNNVGDVPKLNIRFKYSYKRDMSPISLLEFNEIANITNNNSVNSFNYKYAHSTQPFVGVPFIDIKMRDPKAFNINGGVSTGSNAPNSSIRLKFKSYSDPNLTDNKMFRASMTNR